MFFELAIIGTSASGKSDIANALADEFQAVILSLDSLCVYKEINIASAKPDTTGLEYFGINLLSVTQHFNVALFFDEYKKAKNRALELDKPLIIVGGTSFYLKALMSGLSQRVKEQDVKLSNDAIYELMKKVDLRAKIAPNDTYRLKKWLNIYEQTGQIPSEFLQNSLQEPLIKELEIYELVVDKEILRKRVEFRTQNMLKMGLIEEARALFARFSSDLKPLNSIGLKETRLFLQGLISKDELFTLITTHTMQLAKRQRTFNKKFQSIQIQAGEALKLFRQKMKKA